MESCQNKPFLKTSHKQVEEHFGNRINGRSRTMSHNASKRTSERLDKVNTETATPTSKEGTSKRRGGTGASNEFHEEPRKKRTCQKDIEHLGTTSQGKPQQEKTQESKDGQSLEDRVKSLEDELASAKQELKELKSQKKSLKEEVNMLKSRVKKLQDELTELKRQSSPKHLLCLSQLCWKIQYNIYRHVLPPKCSMSRFKSYKVKYLEEDIQTLPQLTKPERKKAMDRWDKLKFKLKWDRKYVKAMEDLQGYRNYVSHPQLTLNELKKSVKEIAKSGGLTEWLSITTIHKLIEMWEKL